MDQGDPINDGDKAGDSERVAETRKAYSIALLRTLSFAKVKFVRYLGVDLCNTVRCKAVPVDHLIRNKATMFHQVATAEVVFGGLPSFADYVQPDSGLDPTDIFLTEPDMKTFRVVPYAPASAVVLTQLCDPCTGIASDLCTRTLLGRVVQRAAADHGVAFNVGIEIEFTLFDAKSDRPVDQSVYGETTTLNQQQDFLSDLYDNLRQQQILLDLVHAESLQGQLEIVLSYQTDPVRMADWVLLARETVTHIAHRYNLKAIFLPKIDPAQAGNGCHVHLSLRDAKTGRNLVPAGTGCTDDQLTAMARRRCRQSFLHGSASDMSDTSQFFIEGILHHLSALTALTMPTTNSFRRVGPGCWTGSRATWAFEDKESSIRVCSNLEGPPSWEHFETKLCDNTANLYLALAGILAAGVDGLVRRTPLRPSRREQPDEQQSSLPGTFTDALECLEGDPLFQKLLPPRLLKAYLSMRRAEIKHGADKTLQDELQDALEKA